MIWKVVSERYSQRDMCVEFTYECGHVRVFDTADGHDVEVARRIKNLGAGYCGQCGSNWVLRQAASLITVGCPRCSACGELLGVSHEPDFQGCINYKCSKYDQGLHGYLL